MGNYSNSAERGMKAINEIVKMAGLENVVAGATENNIAGVAVAVGFTGESRSE